MSHFALLNIFDQPWLSFRTPDGGVVRLPAGTIPAVIHQDPEGALCTMVVLAPGAECLRITVKGTSDEVLAQLAHGVNKINRVSNRDPVPLRTVEDFDWKPPVKP
jgi:hypothetical protein